MTRLRISIRMESSDAFELKAQALNKDPRLLSAGISALRFTGDKNYIADGEFSPDLPPPAAPLPDSGNPKSGLTIGEKLRVVLRMSNRDAYELKAQALNNDPRLKEVGIAALKFVGEKLYISAGEFSPDLPASEPEKPKPDSSIGERLRVVLRMSNRDAYELKAQALNNDPHLKEPGISAFKFVGDKRYISGGEFSPETANPSPKPGTVEGKKLRVVLRGTRQNVYELVARHLNHDPALIQAGISGVELAKGAGIVPVAKETPAPSQKKKRSFARFAIAAVVVALLGVTGAGALFFSSPPAPTPQPTGTEVVVIPVSGNSTATETLVPPTETSVPPTVTKVVSTKTLPPTATDSPTPTVQAISCQAPEMGTILPGSVNCRYGPGENYLYEYGLYQGDQVPILGRQETANQGTWLYVQTESEFNIACWVNTRLVEADAGDVACLDNIYPETGGRPIYPTDLFPPPRNVSASRSGDLVFIAWDGYDLLPGDWEGGDRPRYLLELWTCQSGQLVLTPLGTLETFASIRDEGGCAERSHGNVYMAHVDGYIGPSIIPWPP